MQSQSVPNLSLFEEPSKLQRLSAKDLLKRFQTPSSLSDSLSSNDCPDSFTRVDAQVVEGETILKFTRYQRKRVQPGSWDPFRANETMKKNCSQNCISPLRCTITIISIIVALLLIYVLSTYIGRDNDQHEHFAPN